MTKEILLHMLQFIVQISSATCVIYLWMQTHWWLSVKDLTLASWFLPFPSCIIRQENNHSPLSWGSTVKLLLESCYYPAIPTQSCLPLSLIFSVLYEWFINVLCVPEYILPLILTLSQISRNPQLITIIIIRNAMLIKEKQYSQSRPLLQRPAVIYRQQSYLVW